MDEYRQRLPEVIYRIALVIGLVLIAWYAVRVLPHPEPAASPAPAISLTRVPHLSSAELTHRAEVRDPRQDQIDDMEGRAADFDETYRGGPLD
jgi:hypothetical protein